MEIEEFIERVQNEPARTLNQSVWNTPPEVMAKAGLLGGLPLAELLSAPGRTVEQRVVRYGHILGSSASAEAVDRWLQQHGESSLPADLRALLARIDGIHLWANLEKGRSYWGVAPVVEWSVVQVISGRTHVVITYDSNGDSFIALSLATGRYYLMDIAGPDETAPIASNVGELLDWLWKTRIEPKPSLWVVA
jgi:hypothetical protein